MNGIQNAQAFVEELFRLAQQFKDQPVAIIEKDGKLQVGVMSLYQPDRDDWMYNPVPVENLPIPAESGTSDR